MAEFSVKDTADWSSALVAEVVAIVDFCRRARPKIELGDITFREALLRYHGTVVLDQLAFERLLDVTVAAAVQAVIDGGAVAANSLQQLVLRRVARDERGEPCESADELRRQIAQLEAELIRQRQANPRRTRARGARGRKQEPGVDDLKGEHVSESEDEPEPLPDSQPEPDQQVEPEPLENPASASEEGRWGRLGRVLGVLNPWHDREAREMGLMRRSQSQSPSSSCLSPRRIPNARPRSDAGDGAGAAEQATPQDDALRAYYSRTALLQIDEAIAMDNVDKYLKSLRNKNVQRDTARFICPICFSRGIVHWEESVSDGNMHLRTRVATTGSENAVDIHQFVVTQDDDERKRALEIADRTGEYVKMSLGFAFEAWNVPISEVTWVPLLLTVSETRKLDRLVKKSNVLQDKGTVDAATDLREIMGAPGPPSTTPVQRRSGKEPASEPAAADGAPAARPETYRGRVAFIRPGFVVDAPPAVLLRLAFDGVETDPDGAFSCPVCAQWSIDQKFDDAERITLHLAATIARSEDDADENAYSIHGLAVEHADGREKYCHTAEIMRRFCEGAGAPRSKTLRRDLLEAFYAGWNVPASMLSERVVETRAMSLYVADAEEKRQDALLKAVVHIEQNLSKAEWLGDNWDVLASVGIERTRGEGGEFLTDVDRMEFVDGATRLLVAATKQTWFRAFDASVVVCPCCKVAFVDASDLIGHLLLQFGPPGDRHLLHSLRLLSVAIDASERRDSMRVSAHPTKLIDERYCAERAPKWTHLATFAREVVRRFGFEYFAKENAASDDGRGSRFADKMNAFAVEDSVEFIAVSSICNTVAAARAQCAELIRRRPDTAIIEDDPRAKVRLCTCVTCSTAIRCGSSNIHLRAHADSAVPYMDGGHVAFAKLHDAPSFQGDPPIPLRTSAAAGARARAPTRLQRAAPSPVRPPSPSPAPRPITPGARAPTRRQRAAPPPARSPSPSPAPLLPAPAPKEEEAESVQESEAEDAGEQQGDEEDSSRSDEQSSDGASDAAPEQDDRLSESGSDEEVPASDGGGDDENEDADLESVESADEPEDAEDERRGQESPDEASPGRREAAAPESAKQGPAAIDPAVDSIARRVSDDAWMRTPYLPTGETPLQILSGDRNDTISRMLRDVAGQKRMPRNGMLCPCCLVMFNDDAALGLHLATVYRAADGCKRAIHSLSQLFGDIKPPDMRRVDVSYVRIYRHDGPRNEGKTYPVATAPPWTAIAVHVAASYDAPELNAAAAQYFPKKMRKFSIRGTTDFRSTDIVGDDDARAVKLGVKDARSDAIAAIQSNPYASMKSAMVNSTGKFKRCEVCGLDYSPVDCRWHASAPIPYRDGELRVRFVPLHESGTVFKDPR